MAGTAFCHPIVINKMRTKCVTCGSRASAVCWEIWLVASALTVAMTTAAVAHRGAMVHSTASIHRHLAFAVPQQGAQPWQRLSKCHVTWRQAALKGTSDTRALPNSCTGTDKRQPMPWRLSFSF